MKSTKDLTQPQPGRVQFYVLTRDGIVSTSAEETGLQDTSQPLTNCTKRYRAS